MTFLHRLAHRISRLKMKTLFMGAATAAVVVACEQPTTSVRPVGTISQLVVTPHNVTLQQNQLQDFTAVGLTAAGDTAQIGVTWSVTGGSLVDTSSNGGRHY